VKISLPSQYDRNGLISSIWLNLVCLSHRPSVCLSVTLIGVARIFAAGVNSIILASNPDDLLVAIVLTIQNIA